MRRALAHVINHGLAGLLRVLPWRYVKVAVRVVPWRIVALVGLVLCVVMPWVLGRLQPFQVSLAGAEAMSILYAVGVLALLAWALWVVIGYWLRRANRGKG